jgi:xanthine dehydrogenase molybdopterin-binding subunit B
MGQGLHTKVAQVAASAFNIPLSSVFISETSTDKVISEVLLKVLSFFLSSNLLWTMFRRKSRWYHWWEHGMAVSC